MRFLGRLGQKFVELFGAFAMHSASMVRRSLAGLWSVGIAEVAVPSWSVMNNAGARCKRGPPAGIFLDRK